MEEEMTTRVASFRNEKAASAILEELEEAGTQPGGGTAPDVQTYMLVISGSPSLAFPVSL
jgi:hypothetical protein